jgi:hypothetical protein
VVETVRIEPSGVRALRGGLTFLRESIHEGMDWGAVGFQKNDPREPAYMTVTEIERQKIQFTVLPIRFITLQKAKQFVDHRNMRPQTLDRLGSFRDAPRHPTGESAAIVTHAIGLLLRNDVNGWRHIDYGLGNLQADI